MMFAFFLSFFITIYLVKYGYARTPSTRCAHIALTPTGGGVAIFIGFTVASFWQDFSFIPGHIWKFYLLASLILCCVGYWDDRYELSYRLRLLVHLVCSLIVMSSGLILKMSWPNDINWHKAITVFILMSLINAANFCDGINGLLSLCSLMCLCNQFFLCPPMSSLVLLMILTTLPFVMFNFPKGKLFLGDAGSTFIGFTLGFVALINPILFPDNLGTAFIHKGFFISLFPMSFLWFDVAFTLLHRFIRNKRLSEAHKEHMFHILYDAHFSHTKITLLYLLGTLLLSVLVWLYHNNFLSFVNIFSIYAILQMYFLHYVWRLKQFA